MKEDLKLKVLAIIHSREEVNKHKFIKRARGVQSTTQAALGIYRSGESKKSPVF